MSLAWNKLHILCLCIFEPIIITALMIIGYGIHASFLQHIGSKLLFKHVFYNGAPPLAGFFADYMAIMGCYIAITHYLTQLLQNRKIQRLTTAYNTLSLTKTGRSR